MLQYDPVPSLFPTIMHFRCLSPPSPHAATSRQRHTDAIPHIQEHTKRDKSYSNVQFNLPFLFSYILRNCCNQTSFSNHHTSPPPTIYTLPTTIFELSILQPCLPSSTRSIGSQASPRSQHHRWLSGSVKPAMIFTTLRKQGAFLHAASRAIPMRNI